MSLIRGIHNMVTYFVQIYATLDASMINLLALRLDKRIELKQSSYYVENFAKCN